MSVRLVVVVVVLLVCLCLLEFVSSQLIINEATPSRISGRYTQQNKTVLFISQPTKLDLRNGLGETILYVEARVNGTVVTMGDLKDEEELLRVVVDAAFALGEQGITGNIYSSALPFYMAAKQISSKSNYNPNSGAAAQARRSLASATHAPTSAPTTPAPTQAPTPAPCAVDPIGSQDLGECGPGGDCWDWVCGDCCYHLGCFCHDNCCPDDVYINPTCWAFLLGFSCDAPFDCEINQDIPQCVAASSSDED